MSKFVRSSKFRHVFGTPGKKEECFDGIQMSKNAWDSNYLDVNGKYIAVCWQTAGGGAIGILDAQKPGKLSKVGLFTGHKGPVLDLQFSPFNDNLVATVSEDTTVKIWQIPQGGLNETSENAAQTLSGHGRKVGTCNFHPSANNVLATSALDFSVKIWDIEAGKEQLAVSGHTGIIQSCVWNYDGSLLATYCKDKKARVIDPRSSTVVSEVEIHPGVKGGRAIWLGNTGRLFTVGFSKTAERQYAVFDPKNMGTPLVEPTGIDNNSGIIMPFYDADTGVLFLAGKGDGNIRYYEYVEDHIHYLTEYKSNVPCQGMAALPKRSVDVNTNEIMRLYKATATVVEPISFKVPRKSDLFQDDLFPDCPSDEPALTADQWFGGKTSAPKLTSLKPGFVQKESKASTSFNPVKQESAGPQSESELRAEYDKLKARVAYLEAEVIKKDARIKELENK
jgi:coronin-1B/1C/6